MFVSFTLFHVDRHLKRLDNHSQYSVEQIGSDCTRIDLRASVFLKFSGGACPQTPLASSGFARTFALRTKYWAGQPPWSKTSSYAPGNSPSLYMLSWRNLGRALSSTYRTRLSPGTLRDPTKTAVLNRLGSLLVLTRDVNSKVFQAEEWSSRSQTIVVNMCANASDRLANTAVEKAIVHKNLGKERSILYIHGSLGCSNTLPCRSKSWASQNDAATYTCRKFRR